MPEISASDWENLLSGCPQAHVLQTRLWGDLKAGFGWRVARLQAGGCGAQLLLRDVLPGLRLAYLAKGPLGADWQALWPEIDIYCRQQRCVFLKVEPDTWQADSQNTPPAGFSPSPHSIQPPRTIILDLQGDESAILGRMKQKTRYNINLALKKGVIVRPSSNLALFHDLMRLTAQRDQFGVHSLAYYQRAYELFHPRCGCELLLAEFEDAPLGAVMVFASGQRAWYFYGASSNEHRDRMPNYLLQWEAMRWRTRAAPNTICGRAGCRQATLETHFTDARAVVGVYRWRLWRRAAAGCRPLDGSITRRCTHCTACGSKYVRQKPEA
jgi:lipid II:glycine glycyltransferase (peptidoglycan interpeptide bridge formation enzyme)